MIVLLIYIFINENKTLRVAYLVLVSYYFYYKSGGIYFYLLFISTLIDFLIGKWLHRTSGKPYRILLLILSLVLNLGILFYFKYTNFFINTLNSCGYFRLTNMDIFLPIGISFYTFQTLSYTIDIYRKKLEPADNFMDFAFFVSFFPQLVAGPIVRASDFLPQIKKPIIIDNEAIGKGVFLIMAGLFKKAVISDYISVNFVDRIFDEPLLYTGFENLMAVYGYAIQIYCDFSGYSDMAIGLALLLGFRLSVNFNAPYKAKSITEFWRRWHISLSSWLKDYLYISMGGSRKGKIRTYINLLITMLLGGLWHGASWKFVIWGAMHGVALAFEKMIKGIFPFKKNIFTGMLGLIFTFHFVCLCWIFFRADSYTTALTVINRILFSFKPDLVLEVVVAYKFIFLLILAGFIFHFTPEKWDNIFERFIIKIPIPLKSLLLVILIWLIIQVKSADVQPFIYFQF